MASQCHRFWMSIQFFIGVIAKVCVAIAKLNFFGFMDFPIFTSFWFCIIRKTISRYHGFPILNYRCFHTTSLVVVNIYFSPSWVLKSNVFWPKINCLQMKTMYFANSSTDWLSKSVKIWLSKWILYVKNLKSFW